MTDPIAQLETNLTDAARRRVAHRQAPARRRLGRGLLIWAGVIAVAGTATAAVIELTGEPSKPLAGPVQQGSPARAYAVSLLPDLRAGHAGWCGSLRLTTGGKVTAAGLGCGPAPAAGDAVVVSGGIGGGGSNTTSISYVVVTAKARSVRFGRSRVATRPDPALPNHWRYAIHIDRTDPDPPAAIPLDARGRTLPMRTAADSRSSTARSRPVTNARPATRCAIGTAPGFIAGYRRAATETPHIPTRVEGRLFNSCAATVFHTTDKRGGITVAILLDAHHPDQRAAALPRSPGVSARRLGPGWLVAYGRAPADRARLLNRLRAHI